jgi:glycogen operon protein
VSKATPTNGILAARRRSIRNLLGTLLLSAGVPMLTAGDEFGRSQRGNNNAYCHDSELTWLSWKEGERDSGILETTSRLLRLRAENPAIRPVRFGRLGEKTPSASQMDWFNAEGTTMTIDDWHSPEERTLQYLAASTPEFEAFNRILLIVHAHEEPTEVLLPAHEGVTGYTRLWDSAGEEPVVESADHAPGERIRVPAQSMHLFRAHGDG